MECFDGYQKETITGRDTFTCVGCRVPFNLKDNKASAITMNYGKDDHGHMLCLQCCGELDGRALERNGALSGYFVTRGGKPKFTNFPGTFEIPVDSFKESWHNMAGRNGRVDFWCTYKGKRYHGVHIGHNGEMANIKVVKS